MYKFGEMNSQKRFYAHWRVLIHAKKKEPV